MMWVMIGLAGGSLVVSQHDAREACEGRAAVLQADKLVTHGRCISMGTAGYPGASSNYICSMNGSLIPCGGRQ